MPPIEHHSAVTGLRRSRPFAGARRRKRRRRRGERLRRAISLSLTLLLVPVRGCSFLTSYAQTRALRRVWLLSSRAETSRPQPTRRVQRSAPIHQTPRRPRLERSSPCPTRSPARYRARDGTDHLVTTDRTPEGRWRVLDTAAGPRDRRRDADRTRRPPSPGARTSRSTTPPNSRPSSSACATTIRCPDRQSVDRAGAAMGSVSTADSDLRARQAAGARPPIRAPEARCGSCAPSPQACAAACGSPTAACSPARCHPSATGRSSSGCCTPTPPRSSSSPRARAAPTASSRSTAGGEPSTTCPAEPPADATGSRRCSRTPSRSSPAPTPAARAAPGRARRRSSASRRGPAAAATSTRSPHSRFLWVDVDEPGELPALWALLAERPCHLLIESGGSGGAHAYWKLAEPLAATQSSRAPVK